MRILTTFPYTEDHRLNVYTFRVPCTSCHKDNSLAVHGSGLFKYNRGATVQAAFPELSAAQRELLLSGLCGVCWDALFATPDGGWEDEGFFYHE